ncbi:MAG: methylaspartate mutase subunit E [Chloroflexi bacterium]|nr:methylaspartate mutase subunit E [Chloroflexota bacterium]
MPDIVNKRLDEDSFLASREQVLSRWPTGKEVDLEEAIERHRGLVREGRNVALKLLEAKSQGRILLQPRAGVATVEQNLEILKYLDASGAADILPLTADSCTRNLRFEDAERAIAESQNQGRSLLTGFPLVNHGVRKTRSLVDALSKPMELRAVSVDRRLTLEVALASGCSGSTGGPIAPVMYFAKDYTLEEALRDHQYVHRLAGYYQERGIPIQLSTHGLLPHACLPPSPIIAAMVLESLMMAEQGVEYISTDLLTNGSLMQDIATLMVCPEMVEEYLKKLGYADVTVFSVCSPWNGAFPTDAPRTYALISYLTFPAVWGRANEVLARSVDQGQNLPSKEANAAGLLATRTIVNLLKDQRPFTNPDVDAEAAQIRREVRTLVDRSLDIGEGDALVACIAAFERGFLPVPFTSNRRYAKWATNVMGVRDAQGAVRFAEFGNVPLDGPSKEYHREKVRERELLDRRCVDYDTLVQSMLSISEGTLVR